MLKKYQLFKESKTVLVKKPWILESSFDVSKEMILNGRLIKELIPDEVNGDFYCAYRELTSLEGCPTKVGKDFYCSHNNLTSLEGCPNLVGRDFYCDQNHLKTLEGCPTKVGRDFSCSYNELTTLKGSPTLVDRIFYCNDNQLTNLDGAPLVGKDFISFQNNVDLTIERHFIISGKYKGNKIETYWTDLLQYMIDEKIDLNKIISWPDEFIETLDDQYKNMFKSFKGTRKFNL